MKISLISCTLALLLATKESDAFSPSSYTSKASFVIQRQQIKQQNDWVVLHMNSKTTDEDLEEEVARMVDEAKKKSQKLSKLSNERGVEYAPWMGIRAEDEARIQGIMRERAEARRRREREQQTTRGSLLKDSTNQELSGTGLKSKMVDSNSVELEWATGSEKNTKGFLVKRRTAKSGEAFETIASYETFGPLATKGIDGGVYRFLDQTVEPGNGYVYRITECEANGEENDLSQCLVEIQTDEEQNAAKIALAGLAVIAIAAFASAFLLDPLQ